MVWGVWFTFQPVVSSDIGGHWLNWHHYGYEFLLKWCECFQSHAKQIFTLYRNEFVMVFGGLFIFCGWPFAFGISKKKSSIPVWSSEQRVQDQNRTKHFRCPSGKVKFRNWLLLHRLSVITLAVTRCVCWLL